MNRIKLRNNLTEKLAFLSEEQLNLISQLVDEFNLSQDFFANKEKEEKILKKWQYLLKNNRELDESQPLSDSDIKIICQILIKENKTRPGVIANGEFTIPDNFNDP